MKLDGGLFNKDRLTKHTRTFLLIFITLWGLQYFSFRSECSTLKHSLHKVDHVEEQCMIACPVRSSQATRKGTATGAGESEDNIANLK